MERQYYYESRFYEWHSVHQLPHWVKKGFGWFCPGGTEKPCPKHGLYYYQHPVYLLGKWFEYKLVRPSDSNNRYESVLRRALPVRIPPPEKIGDALLNSWIDITDNTPGWVLERIEEMQKIDPNLLFGAKDWKFEFRHSIYRVIITDRGEISRITRRRKKKEYFGYMQH